MYKKRGISNVQDGNRQFKPATLSKVKKTCLKIGGDVEVLATHANREEQNAW